MYPKYCIVLLQKKKPNYKKKHVVNSMIWIEDSRYFAVCVLRVSNVLFIVKRYAVVKAKQRTVTTHFKHPWIDGWMKMGWLLTHFQGVHVRSNGPYLWVGHEKLVQMRETGKEEQRMDVPHWKLKHVLLSTSTFSFSSISFVGW